MALTLQQARARLAATTTGLAARYGVVLQELRVDQHHGVVTVCGWVVTAKQRRALVQTFADLGGDAPAFAVDVLAAASREDPRLPDRVPYPGEPVALFAGPAGDELATEWVHEDGPSRLFHSADRWLIQLVDGALGWADSDGLVVERAAAEHGPFVEALGAGEGVAGGARAVAAVCGAAVEAAKGAIPYLLGGRTLSGIDCSAFVQRVLRQETGALLARHTTDQMKAGQRVAKGDTRPGDLVFARTREKNIMHVALVVEDDQVAHACRLDGVVRCEGTTEFFGRYRFLKARRVLWP